MATAVLMPKAGISVESCIIGKWRKSPGDVVVIGEILFDYETDKASFECESTAEGTLLEIFFPDGEEVPVLIAVCAVGQPGEDVSPLRPGSSAGESQGAPPPQEQAGQPASLPASPGATAPSGSSGGKVSPRAKSLARQMGVDPAAASPSGPYGRIIARDVEALAASARVGDGIGGRVFDETPAPVSPPLADAAPQGETAAYTDEKFTKIRRSIAKSMLSSLANSAQLTHHHSFDASQVIAYRKLLKEQGEPMGLDGVSLGDILLFAVSRVLKRHPDLNAHLLEGGILRRFHGVHLGMAVDTPRGLLVPTIFDADQKSLAQISKEVKELAAMARSGSISPDLLGGATFTVSNLGALDVEMFTPILNPPQVGILGVCGISTRVRQAKDGSVGTYPAMGLSITYDHRAVDGAPASRFARDLSRSLESFQLLMAV